MKKGDRFGRLIILLLILSLLLTCFSGCGGNEEAQGTSAGETNGTEGEMELWVLTDRPSGSFQYDIYEYAAEVFCREHDGVTVRFESIPSRSEGQEEYLQQLRVQILAGDGPDIYLLDSYNPLFPNAVQSMYNGHFLDISEYYDADERLNKEGFASGVMEAGVLDGARYILPMYYDIPVLYVDTAQLEASGLKLDSLGTGISGLPELTQTLAAGSYLENSNLLAYLANFFPEVIDYETDNVVLTEEELAGFLEDYKSMLASLGTSTLYSIPTFSNYIAHNFHWTTPHYMYITDEKGNREEIWRVNGSCVFFDSLYSLAQNLRIAKATDIDMAVVPVRAADGSLIASVTYYGAVGASCDDPGLAYEFLGSLLLEEHQWKNSNAKSETLYFLSWPVLVEGSWESIENGLWKAAAKTDYDEEEMKARENALYDVTLTEEDFAVLDVEISKAVFYIGCEKEIISMIKNRLDPSLNPDAANVDVHELARDVLQEISWTIAEG